MNSWKKIAAMFNLSVLAALFGAACTAEVEDTTEPLNPSAPVEATAEAESELSPNPIEPYILACQRKCYKDYAACTADPNYPESLCAEERNKCLQNCGGAPHI